jgi:actin-related protein
MPAITAVIHLPLQLLRMQKNISNDKLFSKYTKPIHSVNQRYSKDCAIGLKKPEFCDMSKIHIGKKIKEVLDNSPMKATELAKRINITRVGVYKIFEKESISTEQLQKFSTILKHDFFAYYQKELNTVSEHAPKYGFAAKEDVEVLTHLVNSLAKEIEKMQQELAKLANAKSTAKPVKKAKGK